MAWPSGTQSETSDFYPTQDVRPPAERISLRQWATRPGAILPAWCCVTVATALALLWNGNDTWLYSNIGDLDTWVYVGYALHWNDPQFMQWYYKASRLPWILYEFAHYQLFGPERAVPIVQMDSLLLLLVGNYLFTRRLFGSTVSSLTSIALVLWTHIHANAGADYHNTLCGPLFVWCAYAILYLNQKQSSPPWFVIPGALYLALVVTNPFYINIAPALIVVALFTRHNIELKHLVFSGLWTIFGGALAFLVLGLTNVAFGRNFIFVEQIFMMTKFLAVEGGNTWWKGWGSWVLEARSSHLGPLAAMLVIGIVELVLIAQRRRTSVDNRAALIHIVYILELLIWIGWQSLGQTTLDYYYFAFPLWTLWFWSLAAVLAVRMQWHTEGRQLSTLLAAPAIAFATAAVLLYASSLHRLSLGLFHYVTFQAGAIVLVFYCVIVVSAFINRKVVLVAAFALFYPFADLLAADFSERHSANNCPYGVDGFRNIISAHRFITDRVGTPELALIWFDENESVIDNRACPRKIRYNTLGYVIGNTGLTPFGPWWPMKSIDAIPIEAFNKASDPRHVVAVVTSTPSHVDKMRRRFSELGIATEVIDQRNFHSETLDFSIYLLRANNSPK